MLPSKGSSANIIFYDMHMHPENVEMVTRGGGRWYQKDPMLKEEETSHGVSLRLMSCLPHVLLNKRSRGVTR